MSSETSTSQVRLKPGATDGDDAARIQTDPGLQPWQFFVLAALGCATAVTFVSRGQGPTVVILLGVLMGAAALVAPTRYGNNHARRLNPWSSGAPSISSVPYFAMKAWMI